MATTPDGYYLSPRSNDIRQRIEADYLAGRLKNRPRREEPRRGRRGRETKIAVGLLSGELTAPSSFTGMPTSVQGQRYKAGSPGAQMQPTGDPVDLYNYHPSLTGSAGDYFVAVWLFKMWYVIDVQCPPESPGV